MNLRSVCPQVRARLAGGPTRDGRDRIPGRSPRGRQSKRRASSLVVHEADVDAESLRASQRPLGGAGLLAENLVRRGVFALVDVETFVEEREGGHGVLSLRSVSRRSLRL